MQEKRGLFAPSFTKRLVFFLGADFVLFFVSLHFAYALRFDFSVPTEFMHHFYLTFFTLTLLKWGSLYIFGVYHLTWRYFSLHNAQQIILAHILATGLFLLIFLSYSELFSPLPRSIIAIDFVLSLFLVGALRLSKRLISEQQSKISTKPMIIIGANHKAVALIKSAKNGDIPYSIQAIIAWEPSTFNLCGSYMDAVKIYPPQQLERLCKTYEIQSVAITIDLPQDALKSLLNQLSSYNIHDIQRSVILENNTTSLKQFSIEDLLARHPQDLDKSAISSFIQNKTVLITGAGGSIGSEIALQCDRFGAKKLILIDHSEYNLYQIGEKLPEATLRLCNILNRAALDAIMETKKPDIVIHAAAYKHVPLCEANIQSAIMNNVQGSCNVIDSAIAYNVPKIVIISTDKAVRPTNVMGTTKRIVELYAQNVDSKNSEIAAVRFGNVLGSSGSVIPKFKAQIEAGGPITLTHPDITRYFMLISEACQLVLQAAAIAKGKELFILDMGEPVKIVDLARTMIKLYAKEEIEIVMSGLRPGEKLYEELLIDDSEQKTSYASIMIAGSTHYPIQQLNADIQSLLEATDPVANLKNIVPEFTPDTLNL
ncbi:MAG: nucleoside-diphosphate sugar epimerase/dehydratase [Sulfuricurvum sp.]|nr:nucleoside-diphosphate sugar epimerase/dehydratase [Sulfuricurvum sp.]